MKTVSLVRLIKEDREQFIKDNQEAFNFGALEEFFNSHHPDPNDPDMSGQMDEQFPDGMFRFEKNMNN